MKWYLGRIEFLERWSEFGSLDLTVNWYLLCKSLNPQKGTCFGIRRCLKAWDLNLPRWSFCMNTRSALAAEFACSRQRGHGSYGWAQFESGPKCYCQHLSTFNRESHRHEPPELQVFGKRQADFEEAEKKDAKLSKDELKVRWTRTRRTRTPICPPLGLLWHVLEGVGGGTQARRSACQVPGG